MASRSSAHRWRCPALMVLAALLLARSAVDAVNPGHKGKDMRMPIGCAALPEAAARFGRLLQFETVSDREVPLHVRHPDQFEQLHDYLAHTYPNVWGNLTVDKVGEGGYSLLLEWTGSEPDLDPILFISHLDVVPVASETLDQWTYPPFSGAVEEGFIWGRGALDVKIGVAGLLEAVSLLLEEGWQPTRTLLLAFGQDEEVGGDKGAGATSELLKARGVDTLDAVIDEGSVVFIDGFAPYTTLPIALVATAEKGYYSLKVRVSGRGGHSSIPPIDHTAAATAAARLVLALDEQPPPAALVPPITDFLRALAPLVDKPWLRTMFLNPEVPQYTDRILHSHLLVDTPLTAALARTTVAVTGIQAYVGDNVLPPTATLNLNFRTLPGESVDDILSYVNSLITSLGLNATLIPGRQDADPSEAVATPVTPATGRHFAAIRTAMQEQWASEGNDPLVVAPYMLTGGTDSKHYLPTSKGGVLRFVPVTASKADEGRVHGINERLSVEDLSRAICVYRRAVQLMAGE